MQYGILVVLVTEGGEEHTKNYKSNYGYSQTHFWLWIDSVSALKPLYYNLYAMAPIILYSARYNSNKLNSMISIWLINFEII